MVCAFREGAIELCTHEILLPTFLAALHTTMCLDITLSNINETLSQVQIFNSLLIHDHANIICDRACKNRARGHMIFAYFFTLSSLITFVQLCYGIVIFSS